MTVGTISNSDTPSRLTAPPSRASLRDILRLSVGRVALFALSAFKTDAAGPSGVLDKFPPPPRHEPMGVLREESDVRGWCSEEVSCRGAAPRGHEINHDCNRVARR